MKAVIILFLMLMNGKGNLAFASANIYISVKQEVMDDCLRVPKHKGVFKTEKN